VPFIAVGLFLAAYLGPRVAGVRVNTSASMPRGLYRVVEGELSRGAVVAACLPLDVALFGLERHYLGAGTCPGGAKPVVKKVGGLAGDLLEVTTKGVVVNGEVLPRSRPLAEDRGGRPLAPFPRGPRRLAAGEVWLYSPHEARSWDSRYYGPIPASNVLHVVAPLVTFR
jgi:conjugative transfer signal peptidase TraF